MEEYDGRRRLVDGPARVPAIAVGAVMAYSCWAASVPGGFFLHGLAAILLWLALICIWVLWLFWALAHGAARVRAQWLRWLVLPWAAVFTVAAIAGDTPLRVRFELSRGALEATAAQVAGGTCDPATVHHVGLFDVDRVDRAGTAVRFRIADSGFLDSGGLVWSDAGTPPNLSEDSYEHLDGPWYTWIESW